ncbi:MAG: hypothetical protein FJ318_04515, partial [SAR202 cluster bacterium]|nr:hypothetical protein [SAR202 cluster bacterium]
MEWAWLIPAFGFGAFAVIAPFRGWLPWQGKHISVLAVLAGFIVFWVVLFDLLSKGVGLHHFQVHWFTVGDLSVAGGILVDPATVMMLGLVTFVALVVQVYSLGYMQEH